MNSIGKRPEVKLMHSSIIHVRRKSLLINLANIPILNKSRVSHDFLLITDEVLRSSLNTRILVSHDSLLHRNTGEVRIRRETLPVTTRVRRASKRTGDRAEEDVSTLGFELLSHCET